ncbi:MAG TPA: DUF6485 family protein [Clostridia bacterium]
MDCIQDKMKSACTCTYTSCSKRGKCCACVEFHRKAGELPGCFFSKEAEKTYDRSIKNFLKDAGGK